MMVLFHLVFLVGLAKFFWDTYKSSLIAKIVMNFLFPPSTMTESSCKAVKQISGVYHVPYVLRNKPYTFVVPKTASKRSKWDTAKATMENQSEVDVTELVLPYAGPKRNFFGIQYSAKDLIRGADRILFYEERILRFSFV